MRKKKAYTIQVNNHSYSFPQPREPLILLWCFWYQYIKLQKNIFTRCSWVDRPNYSVAHDCSHDQACSFSLLHDHFPLNYFFRPVLFFILWIILVVHYYDVLLFCNKPRLSSCFHIVAAELSLPRSWKA